MQITTLKSGSVTIVVFDGRLDSVTAADAEPTVLDLLKDGDVVVDLEAVRYMSSAGLRLFLKAAKAARAGNINFSVCGSQSAVRDVFEISGFNKVISSFATRAEALGER